MSTGDGSNCWYGLLWPPWPLGKQVFADFFMIEICSLDSATISFPTTKFSFVADCNHIVKSNNKWLWLNNFRLARLAAPLLAAALNKVFFLQNCTSQFSSRSQFEKITMTFFSILIKVTIWESHVDFFLLKVGVVTVIKCGLAHDQLTAVLEEARLQRRWSW